MLCLLSEWKRMNENFLQHQFFVSSFLHFFRFFRFFVLYLVRWVKVVGWTFKQNLWGIGDCWIGRNGTKIIFGKQMDTFNTIRFCWTDEKFRMVFSARIDYIKEGTDIFVLLPKKKCIFCQLIEMRTPSTTIIKEQQTKNAFV